jgi:hypothetical protein
MVSSTKSEYHSENLVSVRSQLPENQRLLREMVEGVVPGAVPS